MPDFLPIDPEAQAARRRALIDSGAQLVANMACYYCGTRLGKGALWCSTGCAQSFNSERQVLTERAARGSAP